MNDRLPRWSSEAATAASMHSQLWVVANTWTEYFSAVVTMAFQTLGRML